MSEKRKVEDSELEQVHGGGGVMDPPGSQVLEQVDDSTGGVKIDSAEVDFGNDMIQTQPSRE